MRTLRWTGFLSLAALVGAAATVWGGVRAVDRALSAAFDMAGERE